MYSERNGAADSSLFDDFAIAGGATIRTISWQGVRNGPQPARFYVAIIADGGDRYPKREYLNQRYVPLWSYTYSMAQVMERLEISRPCENSPRVTCSYYDYAVGVNIPFVAAPGTRYWLSIQAESEFGQQSGFSWRKGIRDNGYSLPGAQYANTTFPWDFAFALRP